MDLFPDDVYLFTPKGQILALPRNATALDFAYFVHTDVGNHAVAARVDKKLVPLRTRLNSGETVEIITAPSAQPHPQWLEWVVIGRARIAIRNHLKHLQHEDAVEFGHRMLDRALETRGVSLEAIPAKALDRYLAEAKYKRLEELLADIALGNRMPDQVAAQLAQSARRADGEPAQRSTEKILITGSERGVLSFGNCCHPVPGDDIVGYLSAGKGIVVHRQDCPNVAEYRKTPERIDRDRLGPRSQRRLPRAAAHRRRQQARRAGDGRGGDRRRRLQHRERRIPGTRPADLDPAVHDRGAQPQASGRRHAPRAPRERGAWGVSAIRSEQGLRDYG